MTVHFTEEMLILSELIDPWLDGCKLREDAPSEIVEAEKRFHQLFEEQYQFELSLL